VLADAELFLHNTSGRRIANRRLLINMLLPISASPSLFLVPGHKAGIICTETLSQGLPVNRKIVRNNNER